MQTKVMIASSKRLGMPMSFTSGITCSISVPSKRSNVIWKTSFNKGSLSSLFVSNVLSHATKGAESSRDPGQIKEQILFASVFDSPKYDSNYGTRASHTYRSQTEGTQVMRLSLHTTINQRAKDGMWREEKYTSYFDFRSVLDTKRRRQANND